MLAILSTGHITITEHSALRRAPATLTPSCQVPLSAYVSSVWSPDNGSLYVATTDSVNRYDASGTLVKSLWPLSDGDDIPLDDIGGLAVKDKGTLILSMGNTVHMIEHSSSASSPTKIVQTLPEHPDSNPIHALSLSHDSTLLTVASPNAVIVHNLALGTQTTLRKLPGRVAVCTFHVHSRVRLLLGISHKLVIYDITRPSGPSRVTSIGDGVSGDVVAVACSPYSKTLIAVACSGGYVALVDLDKELSLIRSFHYKVSVTSLLFSVDGASLYIGTEDGKLLVQTLRSTEPPKIIAVGEHGCRVKGLAVTKKSKLSIDANSKTTGSINTKPLNQHDINSPLRLSANRAPHPPPMKKSSSESPETSKLSPKSNHPPIRKRVNSATALGSRGIVSSVRSMFASDSPDMPRGSDPARLAVRTKNHTAERRTTPTPSPTTPIKKPPSRVSLRSKPSSSTTLSVPESSGRKRTLSGSTRCTDISETKTNSVTTSRISPRARTTSAPKSVTKSPATVVVPQRTKVSTTPISSPASRVRTSSHATSVSSRQTTSATTRGTATSGGVARDKTRQPTTPSSRRIGTTRARSLVPPVPSVPTQTLSTSTLMVSPEPMTPPLRNTTPPFPIRQDKTQKKGLSNAWAWYSRRKGEGKGKDLDKDGAIEFPTDSGDDLTTSKLERSQIEELIGRQNSKDMRRLRTLSVQATPRKAAWAMSPLRNSIAEGSPGVNGVAGLLHALISDAMLDFRQETRAEMVGLHLDLVRMGGAWRKEMRAVMQEYVGDLKELREENRKLREDNERLRRGY
ncbi:hypothetical protein F5888DRAFT_1664297 [Russula emetica]|nr:hypothetical protein F5888DRAFT_1664297 [Russula emetica]